MFHLALVAVPMAMFFFILAIYCGAMLVLMAGIFCIFFFAVFRKKRKAGIMKTWKAVLFSLLIALGTVILITIVLALLLFL